MYSIIQTHGFMDLHVWRSMRSLASFWLSTVPWQRSDSLSRCMQLPLKPPREHAGRWEPTVVQAAMKLCMEVRKVQGFKK